MPEFIAYLAEQADTAPGTHTFSMDRGSETTRNTIAAGMLALMERPEQWAALRGDRSLLPGAVEEMLRWASSTIYNRRTAKAVGTYQRRVGLARTKVVSAPTWRALRAGRR